MTPRVASLLRVSTDDQVLDNQRAPVLAWAKAQELGDVAFYEEDGISGIAKKRPVRDALLQACRDGVHDVVVVAALDRIGRSASEVILIVDEFAKRKPTPVRLVSLREGLDFSTTIGQMCASLLAFIAQLEREFLSSRTSAGKTKDANGVTISRRHGKRWGRRPLLWTPEGDAQLLALRATKTSVEAIAASKTITCLDARAVDRDGLFCSDTQNPEVGIREVPVHPGVKPIRRRLSELRKLGQLG